VLESAWIIPALPAASFVAILLFGRRLPRGGSLLGTGTVGAALLGSVVAAVQWVQRVDDAAAKEGMGTLAAFGRGLLGAEAGHAGVEPVVRAVTWWESGPAVLRVGTHVDGLTVMMLVVVCVISFLVHVYSTAYMHGDERFTYFYAALSLFTASMLLLVVAENTLQLLVGWELVGLCSFMLIGHWWEERPNTNAAIKAFLTTRTGDVGLLVGVVLTGFMVEQATGRFSFGISAVNEAALSGKVSSTLLTVTAAGLLLGIIGKSGQFPLHTWLPDAMAGPTPVSALIHAATMVVAGVFLGARVYPVFWEGFTIASGGVNPMAAVGAITIVIGALLAFVQDDIKKVLAYSTISQLGYMVMGLGVGAWVGAVFHLFTHAFFKALLFLGAGSISHSGSHHSFDMRRDMGGLRHHMPVTFWTFMIGSAALAGLFPLAGFWSKDEILATASQSDYDLFMVVGIIGAVLTASYMTRCISLTFFGTYRGHGHPHESPPAITVPLVVLAALSLIAGFANAVAFGIEHFITYVEPTVAFPKLLHPDFDGLLATVSVGLALAAIGTAAWLWSRPEPLGPLAGLTRRNAAARAGDTLLRNKYYLDALYEDVIVAGVRGPLARASYWVNQRVIDAVVNGTGRATAHLGRLTYRSVDQGVIDAGLNGLAAETGALGGLLRRLQSGRLPRYALGVVAGVVVIGAALVLIRV
jgi:NADH-quinone oxidoreductase subunit L